MYICVCVCVCVCVCMHACMSARVRARDTLESFDGISIVNFALPGSRQVKADSEDIFHEDEDIF